MSEKVYIAIDLKSFYASVECMERGYDPMTTNWWWQMPAGQKRPSAWPFLPPEILRNPGKAPGSLRWYRKSGR